MQFHLNGFRPGDPRIAADERMSDEQHGSVDVLIVGCGPAGLTLAAQLSAFGDIRTRIVEQKSGPLEFGQADGIACRSMEMFEAFGLADQVAREAYWVNETTFWRPGPNGGLVRADRIQDVEDDLSEMPHVILSQARVHDFYLDLMGNSPRRLRPDYERRLVDLRRPANWDEPVLATLERLDRPGETETVHARYVVGCDGAHSAVRHALGHELKGQSARQLWGVMDALVVTDFPDIRLKCAIQSADQGSLLIIPREGGYMVRMYIELDTLSDRERAADRSVTPEVLGEKARAILAPWSLEVKDVSWCSAYDIGQRVCDAFDDVAGQGGGHIPRIFIAGDACHTHSPKAGQGMNVSMADTFNLGWKLAAVLRGQAAPTLLATYSEERRAKAKELIDFDRDMARLFSRKSQNADEAAEFQQYFQRFGRFTAGVETRYERSMIVGEGAAQALATGLTVGMRFHSAPVIRLADARRVELGHALKADGRWRMILFAPAADTGTPDGPVARLCAWLTEDPSSPLRRHTHPAAEIDSLIDVRAVFQQGHRDLKLEAMPRLLLPAKGRFGLIDYEKIFCPDLKRGLDIFDARGIDRQRGALVIVRPDQYVADITSLNEFAVLTAFFARFMLPGRREQ